MHGTSDSRAESRRHYNGAPTDAVVSSLTRGKPPGLLGVLPLYLAIATAAGFVDFRVRPAINFEHAFTTYVPAVLDGTEAPPAKYRILAPHAYAAVARWTGLEARDAWFVFRWLCLLAALIAGHALFRTWFDTGPAVAGNALMVVLLWLTFSGGYGHPDHLMELVLFTLGCACIARGWDVAFVGVLALNALNRETSAFLVPLFFFARAFSRRHLTWTAIALAVWLGVTMLLRWRLGWVPYDPLHVAENLQTMFTWPERDLYYKLFPWFFLILAVPALVTIGLSWARQPRFTRVAAAIVAPALMLTGFLFSSVIESRIFTPVLPLLVPGLLFALFPAEPRS
jgi:hypothetical protein